MFEATQVSYWFVSARDGSLTEASPQMVKELTDQGIKPDIIVMQVFDIL